MLMALLLGVISLHLDDGAHDQRERESAPP
jgi:hypothetical protein